MTVTEGGHAYALDFDPTQSINGEVFVVSSDGSGGTDLTVKPTGVLINGLGGPSGFGTSYLPGNDDGSTGAVDITPAFTSGLDLFGTTYTHIYINNNGNITFAGPLGSYTPQSIGAGYTAPIIAPYWADVYTAFGPLPKTGGNSTGSDLVWYDVNAVTHTVTVTWDDVGYYATPDKENAFQVQIVSEGNGRALLRYIYQDIQWTTGSASGGHDGLGGTPARVGYSAGDGQHYYEIPGSGQQNALLNLPTTIGNSGQAGVWEFQIGQNGIYGFANATINTALPIAFGNLRVGGTASQTLSISNTATSPAEALDVTVGAVTGSATGSGSISLLAAGSTDTSDVAVGIDTSTAGAKTGAVTLSLTSDGTGTDGAGQTALPSKSVQVNANVFREATYAITPAPANFIVHVGDTARPMLSITNTAANDGFSENLAAILAATTGSISAIGPTAEIGAQSAGNVMIGFSTATAGTVSGSVSLDFNSDGSAIDGFGPTSIGTQTLQVNATVDNYAVATLAATSGQLTFDGSNYELNLGTVLKDSAPLSTSIAIANSASGPADILSGDLVLESGSGFTDGGSGTVSGIAAGQSATAESISLPTTEAGTFSETFLVQTTGSNSSGYSGALQSRTLTVTGTVENPALPQVNTLSPVDFGAVRIGTTPMTQAISISNIAPPPGQSLDVSATASGNATVGGAISQLAPGATDDTDITAGLNTSTAGVASGDIELAFASEDASGNVTPLTNQSADIAVTGTVYNEASFTASPPPPVILHVGDPGTGSITVQNTAPAPYSENLVADVTGTTAGSALPAIPPVTLRHRTAPLFHTRSTLPAQVPCRATWHYNTNPTVPASTMPVRP